MDNSNLLPNFSVNPFEVLHIPKEAVEALNPNQLNNLVKGFYKALQKVYHPDLGGSEQKAAEINAAYEFLQKAENFETARHLYLSEGIVLKEQWIKKIITLEEKVRNQENEIKKITGKAVETVVAKDSEINTLKEALYANLRLTDAPAGAVTPEQYQNYVYQINISVSEFIKDSETFCQILKDGSYHHLNSPRAKIMPTIHWIFSGAVKNSLSEKAMQILQKNSTSVSAEDMPLFATALRQYILKDNYIIVKDAELKKFMFVQVNDIIPKRKFKNKKFRVL